MPDERPMKFAERSGDRCRSRARRNATPRMRPYADRWGGGSVDRARRRPSNQKKDGSVAVAVHKSWLSLPVPADEPPRLALINLTWSRYGGKPTALRTTFAFL